MQDLELYLGRRTCQTKLDNSKPFTKGKLQKTERNLKPDNFLMKLVATHLPQAKLCLKDSNSKQDQCQKPQKNFFQTVRWPVSSCQLEDLQP